MRLIFSVILLHIFSFGFASDKYTPNKETKALFNDAEWYFIEGDYSNSRLIYTTLLNLDKDNSNYNYKLALAILFDINNPNDSLAELHLSKAIENTTSDYKNDYKERLAPIDAFVYYGDVLRYHYKFDEAIKSYQNYLTLVNGKNTEFTNYVNREINNCNVARSLDESNKITKQIELGPKVISNTKSRSFPVISMDKTVTVYAFGEKNSSFGSFAYECSNQDYKTDDIYFSKKIDGKWGEAINITKELNITNQAFPVSMSADGETLFIVQDDNDDGNIYVSNYRNNKWTPIKKLNDNINSKDWETHACVTPNGETLYFTSDKKGGKGGFDIYYSKIDKNGEWGDAVNLGSTVNTIYDEDLPFIAADNTRLYFCSQGHKNIGGFDIFKSEIINGKFSDPKNIGFALNTPKNDLFYVAEEGSKFTFSRLAKDETVVLEEITKPNLISVKGTITIENEDGFMLENYDIIADNFEIIDLIKDNNKFVFSATKQNNSIRIVSDNFVDKELELNLADITSAETSITIKLERKPGDLASTDTQNNTQESIIEETVSETITETTINNFILFDFNSTKINNAGKGYLESILSKISAADLIEISAFTDTKGTNEYNNKLSKLRAESVKSYLINKGVSSSNIKLIPKGETTKYGAENLNRRAEIIVSKKEESKIDDSKLILFNFDKHNLTKDSKIIIDNIIKNISTNKNIVINAYTDSKGSELYNLELSKKRANSVKNYLQAKGFANVKVQGKGILKTNQESFLKRKAEIVFER